MRREAVLQIGDRVVLPDEIGRPFMAPPGTPVERMAVYRRAFQEMLKDSEFLAQSERLRIAIDPLDDAQIETLFARAYTAPQAIHDRAVCFRSTDGLKSALTRCNNAATSDALEASWIDPLIEFSLKCKGRVQAPFDSFNK